MTTLIQSHEGKVRMALVLSGLLALNQPWLKLLSGESFLAVPLQSVGPSMVPEPVANVVGVTGIDEDRNLALKNGWNILVEWKHPIAIHEETSVDVEVARLIRGCLSTNGAHDRFLVEILLYPVKLIVAETVSTAILADIVDVLPGSLVWTNHDVVTVDRCWYTDPAGAAVVTRFDQTGAAWVGAIHRLTFALSENRWITSFTTTHWAIVVILGETISQTVSNQQRLQIDVAVLVTENLGSKLWNVVTSILE